MVEKEEIISFADSGLNKLFEQLRDDIAYRILEVSEEGIVYNPKLYADEHIAGDQLAWIMVGLNDVDRGLSGERARTFQEQNAPFLTKVSQGYFVLTHHADILESYLGPIHDLEEDFADIGFKMTEEFWEIYG